MQDTCRRSGKAYVGYYIAKSPGRMCGIMLEGAESVVCGCIGMLLPCRVCSEDFAVVNLWPHGGGAESVVCDCIGMLLPCRVCSEGFVEFWKEQVRG